MGTAGIIVIIESVNQIDYQYMKNEMSMTIDKQNGDICFNEAQHIYFHAKDNKKKYISVTTLIHKFEPPFDKDFWSGYKALEQLVNPEYWGMMRQELLAKKKLNLKMLPAYGVTIDDFNAVQQNILDSWQLENLASTERGSKIHADLEHSFYSQKDNISLQKFGLGGSFSCVEGMTELTLDNGVYPEYLISYESPDNKLRIAGQIDLLVKEGNQFSIVDWKTNKQIKTKSYFDKKTKTSEKLKYPLGNLDNCNYNVYNMQLSTYAWMIEQLHPELKCKELVLVHFDHQNNMTTYQMKYLKSEVEKMLEFWKKEAVLQEHREARKRIEY